MAPREPSISVAPLSAGAHVVHLQTHEQHHHAPSQMLPPPSEESSPTSTSPSPVSSPPLLPPTAGTPANIPSKSRRPLSRQERQEQQETRLREFANTMTGDRRRLDELTPEVRAAICAAVAAGQSKTTVARAFGVTRGTVDGTLRRQAEFRTFDSLPRSGRPRKVTAEHERAVEELRRRLPKMRYTDVRERLGLEISESTYKRLVRKVRASASGSGSSVGLSAPVPPIQISNPDDNAPTGVASRSETGIQMPIFAPLPSGHVQEPINLGDLQMGPR